MIVEILLVQNREGYWYPRVTNVDGTHSYTYWTYPTRYEALNTVSWMCANPKATSAVAPRSGAKWGRR